MTSERFHDGESRIIPVINEKKSGIDPKGIFNIDDLAYAGQILDGAKVIAKYLVHLGFSDMTEKKVFQWAADGRLPVKKIGSRLVANKRTLLRHFGLD